MGASTDPGGSLARRGLAFGRAFVGEVREKDVPFMAASIAYQAFVSLLPLLVLLFFALSLVSDEQLAARVVDLTESFLPQRGRGLLEDAIAGTTGSVGTSIIGVVTLAWGSIRIFRGLDKAFSSIYETEARNSLLDQFTDAAVVLLSVGVALTAAVGAGAAFSLLPAVLLVDLWGPVLLAVGLLVAFVPMFYLFPDLDLSVPEVLPGAGVAAVGWTALEELFGVYVSLAGGSGAGVLGAVLLLLAWLYLGSLALLVGGVVNVVLSGRHRGVREATRREQPEAEVVATSDRQLWRDEVVALLRGVEAAFDDDGGRLQIGDEEVALRPAPVVDADVRLVRRPATLGSDEEGLVITVSWRRDAPE